MVATKINAYRVYLEGKQFLGVSDEVTLPDVEALTTTLSGSGVAGEVDEPLIGQFGSMEIEIPFRTFNAEMWSMFNMMKSANLTLRMSNQSINQENMNSSFFPSRVVIKGKPKAFSMGKVKQGEGTGSKVKIEILYLLIEVNKKPKLEIDKLNFICKVNGKDMLEKVRSQI